MNPIAPRLTARDGEVVVGLHLIADQPNIGRILFTEAAVGTGICIAGRGVTVTNCTATGFAVAVDMRA